LVARACEEGKEGEFYRRAEAVPSHHRGLQETPAWARSSGDVRRTVGQWLEAVRPPASVHRPRGTDLSFHASVTVI
jgi:hypothetical protein